jgi:hypothetical protein
VIDTSSDEGAWKREMERTRNFQPKRMRPVWEIEGEGGMDDKVNCAPGLLRESAAIINQRGAKRDSGQERSMARAVRSFSALTGVQMTEVQGWQFMAVLKLAREQSGHDRDNYLDAAAYIALAGECAMNCAYEDGAA